MKKNNLYTPDLSMEQINKIAWEFEDFPVSIGSDSVRQLREIFDREIKRAFQEGFEEGKKLRR